MLERWPLTCISQIGVVWPGVTSFPDWFNPDTQTYWNNQFGSFFDAETGVDIDGLWIDMNEASVGSLSSRRLEHNELMLLEFLPVSVQRS